MANAVSAGWHGHDYQARFFWIHASALRDPDQSHVIEVSYEADGPKAFDDVIIRYEPPRASTGPVRISVDYHQIKFHVTGAGRFGYVDLIDPAFIGAEKVSLLERLKQAKESASQNAAFHLVTIDSVKDNDPLAEIISAVDYSLRLDKLSVGKTDGSKMGKVRKLWREHLKLASDGDLMKVLEGLHIATGQRSLTQLRDDVNLRFRLVGLISCHDSSEFRFDAAARSLKSKGLYQFTREQFETLCKEEGWVRSEPPENRLNVALRSFTDGPNDRIDALPENTLSLSQHFDGRHLRPREDWASAIQPAVESFLARIKHAERRIRLFLDVHTSIAFLAGRCLGLKSGIEIELVQKGRSGTSVWRADDGEDKLAASITTEHLHSGPDIALVLSISRDAVDDVRDYVAKQPTIGKILHITPAEGPGQNAIVGGAHAARLADDVARAVAKIRVPFAAKIHVFSAAPNAFNFFVGQHVEAMGPCVFYEFDFNRRIDGSYHPTFKVQ